MIILQNQRQYNDTKADLARGRYPTHEQTARQAELPYR